MLDADTKRRIDTARDILVGKVPDPKSQVEQITIAMIYKFMDDMDALSEELGGERSFFAGEFGRYGWAKLMQPGLGGHEMLGLYAEAIERMDQNAGIPQLFRDIFSNAFLPYRDPETLRVFLKEIDGFTYDNSERLGDAFEYLLSVMDSQGDAGQFRTPRHIIDFIVSIVDPKKEDVVLDPACGTAGFLISSFKHILAANTDSYGNSTLTPDERARLARNLMGYDISPDMVRLSLVNMYLHGLVDPHIYEYDTLTSEERWNEFADVVLANPPFMSPKGGIRPHKRFSVESKRSEVLFVDYMAEHLNAGGRAGIIVPEGIIFQSQNAHKELRKKLVEECLVAVVSLPGGVFNPYSGVKTSILLLDKALARKTDRIGFFKVANDGFDLGAQRRPIEGNELRQVRDEIVAYLQRLRAGEARRDIQSEPTALAAESMAEYVTEGSRTTDGLIVKKERVAGDGEYNLSGERYRIVLVSSSSWPMVELGELCEINPKKADPTELYPDSYFNYIDISCVENGTGRFLGANRVETSDAPSRARRLVESGDVLISTVRPNLRAFTIMLHVPDRSIASTGFAVLRPTEELLLPNFLINMMRDDSVVDQMIGMMGRGAYPSINQTNVASLKIPLPPLEVQQEIVAEIEGYQKVIDGARAVVENYRARIHVDPDWPMVKLGEFCEIIMGQSPSGTTYNKVGNGVPLINGPVEFGPESFSETLINQFTTAPTKMCQKGDLILCVRGSTTGRMNIAGYSGCIGRGVAAIRSRTSQKWVNYVIHTLRDQIYRLGSGSTFPNVSRISIAEFPIPVPPSNVQEDLVKEFEAERATVAANRDLIERMEKKIQRVVGRLWLQEKAETETAKRAND